MRSLALILLLAGCADDGAMGNATVSTECSPTDFGCVTQGLDGPIAKGGVVPLSIDADTPGVSSGTMTLMAADPTIVKAAGTEIVGLSAGVTALVMLSEGHAIDFLHVYVAEPTRLGLQRIAGGLERAELVDTVELLVGDEMIIETAAYRDSQRLLGHATSTWTAGATLTLLKDGLPSRRRIVARSAGETDLVVSSFGFTKTLHITVLP